MRMEILQFHKDIIRLRKEHDELRNGSIKNMDCDYNFLAYGRFQTSNLHKLCLFL